MIIKVPSLPVQIAIKIVKFINVQCSAEDIIEI